MRLLGTLKFDILFQIKHGFYYLYAIICVVYILILLNLPPLLKNHILPEMLFFEPSLVGYSFVGGILLLEKDQNILENLFITPLRIDEYIISKVISLSLLGLLTGCVITLGGVGMQINFLALFMGLILTGILFTLLGISLACRVKNLNGYILVSFPVLTICMVPFLETFDLIRSPLFYILPSKACIILINGIFSPTGLFDFIYAVTYLLITIVLVYFLTRHWLDKYIVQRIGGAR
jgi:fluoroquinolone transport system permease protein